MTMERFKAGIFFKNMLNAVLGISLEISLVCFFIFAGFLVCLVWWGLLR